MIRTRFKYKRRMKQPNQDCPLPKSIQRDISVLVWLIPTILVFVVAKRTSDTKRGAVDL